MTNDKWKKNIYTKIKIYENKKRTKISWQACTFHHRTYRAEARNNQNAEAGARTYWPSTTPNFKFWSKNCVSTKRTASVTSAKNITNRPRDKIIRWNIQKEIN